MKKVAGAGGELTVEERNLLSVAYKNVIGARRASWRIISSIEQKEESKGNANKVTIIKEYRGRVEKELENICAGTYIFSLRLRCRSVFTCKKNCSLANTVLQQFFEEHNGRSVP